MIWQLWREVELLYDGIWRLIG